MPTIERVNDFVVKFPNVHGSGPASAPSIGRTASRLGSSRPETFGFSRSGDTSSANGIPNPSSSIFSRRAILSSERNFSWEAIFSAAFL